MEERRRGRRGRREGADRRAGRARVKWEERVREGRKQA